MVMRQVIQNYKTGELKLTEVPAPGVRAGGVLVRNVTSAISVGTERQMIELARKGLLGKARARPDLVKQVVAKIKTEGLLETYRQAMNRLDSPVPLGYSCAGKVIEVGEGVEGFQVGDGVACAGHGFASHAEVVCVPQNLCVRIPEGVPFESACFAMIGAIALHGVRTAGLSLGEQVVVIGLGLLGQMACQMAKAAGCKVLAADIDGGRAQMAKELGADAARTIGDGDLVQSVMSFSQGLGADAVLVFASTDTNEPIELAAEVARIGGRVVVPGLVKLDLPRRPFYEKEIALLVPRASGPGSYDLTYEVGGVEYPLQYVRWTERRNMEEFLRLVAAGKVTLDRLITHRFNIEDAEKAYSMITGQTPEKHIGVVLKYPPAADLPPSRKVEVKGKAGVAGEQIGVGFIGAGLFANTTLLPIIRKISGVRLVGVATATGASGRHVADKFGFEYCTSDYHEILNDERIHCVMIATRHDLHANQVIQALQSGKDVFVEKPLALDLEGLEGVVRAFRSGQGRLMVGFNRRFSPFSVRAKEWFGTPTTPVVINCRVNAGFVPKDSWVQDPEQGGGRIVGEACHFIDLVQYLAGSLPDTVYAQAISGNLGAYQSEDNVAITLKMTDGSVASVTYVASGDKAYPRERVEMFGGNSVCVIDNFKSLAFTSGGRRRKMSRLNVDRGHEAELATFFDALKKGTLMPVDFREYVFTTLATFSALESMRGGVPVRLDASVVGLET